MKAGKMNAAAAMRAPAYSPEPVSYVSSQLHHRGPGQHLAQSQTIQKSSWRSQPCFSTVILPHGLHHGQAAEGGKPQMQKGAGNMGDGYVAGGFHDDKLFKEIFLRSRSRRSNPQDAHHLFGNLLQVIFVGPPLDVSQTAGGGQVFELAAQKFACHIPFGDNLVAEMVE